MPERRKEERDDSSDRRDFPRPPLWLTIGLIIFALAAGAAAKAHRDSLDRKFEETVKRGNSAPLEIHRIRAELAEKDIAEDALAIELESKLNLIESRKSNEFFISIDTSKKIFTFNYGDHVVREATVEIGSPQTIQAGAKSWTFIPSKGEFEVQGKARNLAWQVPSWVYVMNKQPVPKAPPTIENGLGDYVIFLPNSYVIHSPPSPDSPLKGPKPASFMVPADDLKAIWERIDESTHIYIF